MHKRGYCRHAVSVCPSVCLSRSWIMSKRINISSKFFHRRVATPFYRTGWRYSGGNPPNGGVKCRWGVGTNRDSGLIAIEDCWMCEVPKTFTHDEAEYMTQSATHHWLSITTGYRSIAGRANYEVTKTVTDDHDDHTM